MNTDLRFFLPAIALAFLSCRADSTGALIDLSIVEADEAPRFSDWSTPVHLGAVVNSSFADFDPFISKDGLSLLFVSGPGRGGAGNRDIWVTQRATIDDPWGTPLNLGPTINGPAHESKPTLSRDGHRLYFASDRAGGLGQFDIYVSQRHDKRGAFGWAPPVNLGSGVNSTASEETGVTIVEDDATGAPLLCVEPSWGTGGLRHLRESPTAG